MLKVITSPSFVIWFPTNERLSCIFHSSKQLRFKRPIASFECEKYEESWVSVGLSRSCSATFEQLFGFGATFSPSSNFSDFEHFFPF